VEDTGLLAVQQRRTDPIISVRVVSRGAALFLVLK
jgi:hypothetical protein